MALKPIADPDCGRVFGGELFGSLGDGINHLVGRILATNDLYQGHKMGRVPEMGPGQQVAAAGPPPQFGDAQTARGGDENSLAISAAG